MPFKPNKPCARSGCPEIAIGKYCSKCEQTYGKTVKRDWEEKYKPNRDPFYGTARWQKARNRYAAKHPLCEDCLERGLTVPMNVVDHIIEIKDGGARLDPDNFRSRCFAHHAEKTAQEKKKRNHK